MRALYIGWKDTLRRFRDWKALAGMLAAPLLISALIGLAFGNLNDTETPISEIALAVVNHDDGELGQIYVDVLHSEDLTDLLAAENMDDLAVAQQRIREGELRAVVYIPAGFSDNLLEGAQGSDFGSHAEVQVFTDPTANISPFIVQSIVEQISNGLNSALLAGQVSALQAADYAHILQERMAGLGEAVADQLSPENFDVRESRLGLNVIQTGESGPAFDPYSFFVPGMAVFFLMFSVFDGSRSILQEQTRGTLPRLITTPTPHSQIILGKMLGTFLTGLLQFALLVLASTLLFGVNWGSSPAGVALIMVLTVFAASGLGALLTSAARNESQAGIVVSAVSLIFGALGGSFFPASNLSGIVDLASRLTVNRWAMEGFTKLTVGRAGFNEILPEAGVLALIGLVTFVLAMIGFKRRFVR
ncbi:MAG: ABC transporter permease [Anaerolineales bacterium]|nr:ABC transporter permease [Anaerolineales bacterium]